MKNIPQKLEAVACDLDGSLYNDDKKISPQDLQTIQKLKAQGIPVFVCTGRAYHFSKDATSQIGEDYPMCCCNGGYVAEQGTGKSLYSRSIEYGVALEVIDYLTQKDIPYIIYTTEQVIFRDNKMARYLHWAQQNSTFGEGNRVQMNFMGDADVDLENATIIKFLLAYITDEQRADFENDMNSDGRFSCVVSDEQVFDVNAAGVCKGDGVAFMARHLGFSMENTMAMGDHFNDLSMLRDCGIAVVPENGLPQAKELADFITCNNNNAPLTYAINHLFPELLK